MIRVDQDPRLRPLMANVAAFLADPSDLARDIAALGKASTAERFRTQVGPDGSPWKPSLRVQLHGGRTLTKDGHLAGSLSARHGRDFAEWGVNRIYAAIHQFGGVIRPKTAAALRFRLANGAFAVAKSINMPARPFLGLSADDVDDFLALVGRRLQGLAGAR